MAKFFKTKRAKKRMIAVLAVALATTLSAGTLAGCSTTETTEEEEEEVTTSQTDTQLVQNGNFEFYTDNEKESLAEKLNLITSPKNWSQSYSSDSGSAPTSDSASGIVNTAEWDNFTKPGRPFKDIDDALAHWEDDDVHAYDRIKFYDEFDIDSVDEFAYYDDYKYAVDFDDIKNFYDEENSAVKVANPGVHTGAKEGETSVLMIQNQKITNKNTEDPVYGTAQKYSSSSTVNLPAGTSAEFSVWVKTQNLTHGKGFDLEKTTDAGAFIQVNHTVGGSSVDAMQIKSINVDDWTQYTFYVRGSTYADSTVSVAFGLGEGSSGDVQYLVNGYAFFDDLTCTVFENEEYETKTAGLASNVVCTLTDEKEAKQFKLNTSEYATETTFALDLASAFTAIDFANVTTEYGLTKEVSGDVTYTTETYGDINLKNDLYSATNANGKSIGSLSSLTDLRQNSNETLQKVLAKDFIAEEYPFDESENVLMLLSANGAPYVAKMTSSDFKLAKDEKMVISFFVKTSEMNGFTGASVTVVDGKNKTSIGPLDSTTLSTVDIKNQSSTKEDIYYGWAQCFFLVENTTEEDKTFALEFNYGPTTIVGSTKDTYTDGYASFARFETCKIAPSEKSYLSTGDRAKSVTLLTETVTTGSKFDDVDHSNPDAIETSISVPANYWGVTSEDPRVGGSNELPNYAPMPATNGYSGLVNSKYAEDYFNSTEAWKNEIIRIYQNNQTGVTLSASDWWNSVFGTATQPLAIINLLEQAYGYIAQTTANISSSSSQRISVRVKVSDGAKAYVYLIDTSDLDKGYSDTLTPNAPDVTYWYDDKGNVVAKDPAEKDFDKKTDILYSLQENGLYKNAQNKEDGKYYANLANYKSDADGNLVTDEDTIAFYKKDGKFYAYYDEEAKTYSVEVSDFDHAKARYDYAGANMPNALVVVDGTNADVANKWVNVAFNVKTGNDAKNYRVEVWSGSRDGAIKNPADSYVLFDNFSSADVSSDYEGLLTDAEDLLKEKLNKTELTEEDGVYHYAYTFYDDTSFLRYDATQDTEEAGNPFASYKQSEKTEGILALYCEDDVSSATELNYQMFLDYSLTDVEVARDTVEEDAEEEEEEDGAGASLGDLFLLGSSIALVAALAIVIISIGVRRVVKKHKKTSTARPIPVKTKKPKKDKPVKEEKPAVEETPDEDDPYNE